MALSLWLAYLRIFSLAAILLHPWLVQTLAMETSPQILLPAGMYESLAEMVCATAGPRMTALMFDLSGCLSVSWEFKV